MITALKLTRRALLATGPGLLLPCRDAAQDSPHPQMRSTDFLSTIAANTHVGYLGSQYRDVAAVGDALGAIGIRRVRDGAPKPGNAARYAALAANGVSFCFFWGTKQTMADALGQISALEAAYPGAVHAIEGPNEIKQTYSYAGLIGNAAAQRFMQDLRAATRADPRLSHIPLVSFTSYERAASDCDFANHHPYPKAGKQPGLLLRDVRNRYVGPNGVMPGKAMVFTEFGYHTLVGVQSRQGGWQGVTPELQAALVLNGLLDNAAQGITRTYVYQLLDGGADANGAPNQENHFGLFRFDGSPKPAAKALTTLASVLEDRGPHDFTPRPFTGLIEAPPPVSALVLAQSSGSQFLALWNESPVWDAAAAAPLPVSRQSVTLTLPSPAPVRAFEVVGTAGPKDLGRTARVTVSVGASPVLLHIG